MSIEYTERLAEAGIELSVGSVGDSYDDALAEPINGLYKAEVIPRRGPWRSFEAVEYAPLEWVDRFNNRRIATEQSYPHDSQPFGRIDAAQEALLGHRLMLSQGDVRGGSGPHEVRCLNVVLVSFAWHHRHLTWSGM